MKLQYILLGLAFTGALTSCEMDFENPNGLGLGESLKTANDMQKWVDGTYAQLRGRSYGSYMTNTDVQTENFNATLNEGNRNGELHGWMANSSTDQIDDTWGGYYTMLKNVNNIIEKAPAINVDKAADKKVVDVGLGEIYAIRAYSYYQLVNLYAKAYYNEATGTADAASLGVPLHLKFDVEERLPRNTVKEVYDQILSDLNKTDSLWGVAGATPEGLLDDSPTRFTPEAIKAFRARVYLSMGEWAKAQAAAESVINGNAYPLVDNRADFAAMWKDDAGSEIIMHLYIDQNETPNENSLYLGGYQPSTKAYLPDYLPTKGLLDLYGPGDYRKDVYFLQHKFIFNTLTANSIYGFIKYPRTTKFTSSGNFAHSPILFRTAEVYLIAAEAAARQGNLAGGLNHLNALRKARGLANVAPATADALLAEVKLERTRELVGEGFHFYDLKRWNQNMDRKAQGVQDENTVNTNFVNVQVNAGDHRFVWGIPANDINLNKALKQNEGW